MMFLLASSILGQGYDRNKGFYGFFGVGSSTDHADATMHYGAGFEALLDGGLGIGIDLGLLHAPNSTADGIKFSVGGLYAFNRHRKTKPFITLGYSAFLVDDHGHNGAFIGGGVNRVLGDNWGIKLEVRDTFDADSSFDNHFIEGRVGILFGWN